LTVPEAMAREGAFVVATDLIAERAEETAARHCHVN
jgi:hypothetical protein